MKKIMIIVTTVLLIVIVLFFGIKVYASNLTKEGLKNISYNELSLDEVEDGCYQGYYESGVFVKLEVCVKLNEILKIEIIEHSFSPIGSKASSIVDSIISRQQVEVDSVTGATLSSELIKAAVSNALNSK